MPAALPASPVPPRVKPVIRGPGTGVLTYRVEVGDIVLLKLDEHIRRPLLVTQVGQVNIASPMQPEKLEIRVSGTIFCAPDDHTSLAVRTLGQGSHDPARIIGRPDRLLPLCYAEYVSEGVGIGQWITTTRR
jgi:hypothetical protein